MQRFINKIILTNAAIIVACIVLYGIVQAQRTSCSTISDRCIQVFKIKSNNNIENPYGTLPSHRRNNQPRPITRSVCMLVDMGPDTTCCESDRCSGHNPPIEFGLSFIKKFQLLNKNVHPFDAIGGRKTSIEQHILPSPYKAAAIYILTNSFIC